MDFQKIVDGMSAKTCVISVETFPDGRYGNFRIVTGNRAYIDSLEHPVSGMEIFKTTFIPGSDYTDYLERDLNFEDFCYRAAVGKKCLHSYAKPDRMAMWFNMLFIPLSEVNDNTHYCLYMMETNEEADAREMSQISADTATSVLETCIRLRGTTDFKATMQDIIKDIRELCEAEHCCILEMEELERSCSVLVESFSENSPLLPMETYLNEEFYDIAESWSSTIAGSNCLIAKNEQDMEVVKERNPVWYESLTSAGASNIVLFPLKSRNQLLGYIWALNFNPERAGVIKETLEVTSFIIGSELGNHILLDRLRMLGSKDLLTGVMNRNEMNNYVDGLSHADEEEKTSVGVIFADLNGLKAINDLEGHNAGDILLKRAANILREFFDEEKIFRAGGDEFSVIVTDTTEEELDQKIEQIRNTCGVYDNVVFALGRAVEDDCRNVRMALRRADEDMYEDKHRFYKSNPDRINEIRIGRRAEGMTGDDLRGSSMMKDINYSQLTGLPGMTYFFKLAENGRMDMHERNITAALVFFNLTGLRYFNKKYGFAAGNILIREFAGILKEIFGFERSSHFGQDYFAVFTEAEGLEDKLRTVFRKGKKMNGGNTLPVRAGIYLDSMGLAEVSLACDRAKYAASIKKDDHSSYFHYYDDEMLSRELNRQYIIDNLNRAIDENWIRAFYQPIVRATNRKICDEEALARWIDPEKGMLSPADFIPILEDMRLIYKVDLHIVDIILERMLGQKKTGMPMIPVSVNLSRTDFEMCDIVNEIDNRVTTAGISKDMLTIEITESVVGENFDFMKGQIERFQNLGYKVWMDDFGSGYSSLDLLQEMRFDLIKFDMRFMRQFDKNPRSRIVLTELMRMAQSLGIETVCEGVETAVQADFLSEVGCTKLQGYFFSKPLPAEEILEKFTNKTAKLSFEAADEAEYYSALGAVNLYDLSAVTNEDTEAAKHYFDTLPMAVVEYENKSIKVARCNKSYREFVNRFFVIDEEVFSDPAGAAQSSRGLELINAIEACIEDGDRTFINESMWDGTSVHAMVRKIAKRTDKDVSAYVVAVLDIRPPSEQQLTYANVAQALSSDYEYLFYVDLETERYVEYSREGSGKKLSVERHGEDFFREARKDINVIIYEDDRERFLSIMTKENVLKTLDEQGVFVHTYRLMKEGVPVYVNMKIVRMEDNSRHIIIGVNNVDTQMRQQEIIEQLEEEQTTFSRISALMGNIIAIYTVDPDTGNYMQYSASDEYSRLGTSRAGVDFFADSIEEVRRLIHPDDMDYFMSVFSKEKILKKIGDGKVYKIRYRLLIHDAYERISLRMGLVREQDGPQIIAGVSRSSEDPD